MHISSLTLPLSFYTHVNVTDAFREGSPTGAVPGAVVNGEQGGGEEQIGSGDEEKIV